MRLHRMVALLVLLAALLACAEADPPSSPPSPAPTLTVQQQLEKALKDDDKVNLECYPGLKTTITEDLIVHAVNESDDMVSWTAKRTKACIYAAQRVTWNFKKITPSVVTIRVDCLLQDKYGNRFTGDCAKALLKSETAKKFAWENLDGESAWGLYDERYLR